MTAAAIGSGFMRAAALVPAFKPYHVVMSLVFAVALAAGWSMLPDDNEIIAMLERDGHSREALKILEDDYRKGDRRYRTLHQMLSLLEDEGKTGLARDVLEQMVQQRPRDAALRDRLAEFYRSTGDTAARIGALQSQIATRYSEAACRELIGLLRLQGSSAQELAALQSCRQKGYRRIDELSRMADLTAVAGDTSQSVSILRAIDDVKRLKSNEDRFQLLALLLDQGQPKEAERRVIRWIKGSKDQSLAVGLIDALAQSRFADSAIAVAKEVGEPGDVISLTVAERMLERNEPQVARLYLKGWLDHADLKDESTIARFVTAASAAGDAEVALAASRKFGLAKLPPPAARQLFDDLSKTGNAAAAAELSAANPAARPANDDAPVIETEPGASGPPAPPSLQTAPGPAATAVRDPLEVWRRSLVSRLIDDAQRRAGVFHRMPRHLSGMHGERRGLSPESTRVFKKTNKVLQKVRRLKSLKMKRRAASEKSKDTGRKP